MLIVGAGGHAKEILQVLINLDQGDNLYFFDDYGKHATNIFGQFKVLNSPDQLAEIFKADSRFIVGVGNPQLRFKLAKYIEGFGGEVASIVSKTSQIGNFNVKLGPGINVMEQVFISNNVSVGEGCLLNYGVSLHHDVSIGAYSELAPQSQVLGNANVGAFCSIGAGATVLPNIVIGDNIIVGAGALVNRNLDDPGVYVGVPARRIK